MKIQNVALIAALTVVAGASSALAGGTGVTNEYVNGTRHVTTDVTVTNYRKEVGNFENISTSAKYETNFPNANGTMTINGTDISGKIRVSTQGPDPFVAATAASSIETGTFKDVTNTTVTETSVGTDSIYRHTVSSQF